MWFGDLGYNNAKYSTILKEEKEESLDLCPFCKHQLLDVVCLSVDKPPPLEFEGFDDEYQWRYLKDIDIELWNHENPERSYPLNIGIRKYAMFLNYSDYINKFENITKTFEIDFRILSSISFLIKRVSTKTSILCLIVFFNFGTVFFIS